MSAPDFIDHSYDVIVIGAGVLGLASAAELSARGLSVIVIDAGGPNASSVAAGMIGERKPDVASLDPSWHHNYATLAWWRAPKGTRASLSSAGVGCGRIGESIAPGTGA